MMFETMEIPFNETYHIIKLENCEIRKIFKRGGNKKEREGKMNHIFKLKGGKEGDIEYGRYG